MLPVVAQNSVPPADLANALSGVSFLRSIGGAIGICIMGSVFNTGITKHSNDYLRDHAPDFYFPSSGTVLEQAAAQARIDAAQAALTKHVVAASIADVFFACVPMVALWFVVGLFFRPSQVANLTNVPKPQASAGAASSSAALEHSPELSTARSASHSSAPASSSSVDVAVPVVSIVSAPLSNPPLVPVPTASVVSLSVSTQTTPPPE